MSHDLIRTLGVAWVGIACFVFAFFVSRLVDNFTPKLDKAKPKWMTFLEVCIQFGIVGAVVYGARMFIKRIHSPLMAWGVTPTLNSANSAASHSWSLFSCSSR